MEKGGRGLSRGRGLKVEVAGLNDKGACPRRTEVRMLIGAESGRGAQALGWSVRGSLVPLGFGVGLGPECGAI